MTTKDESIYVGIENPAEVRKALLESSKNLIKILQKGERIKEKKRQKQQLMLDLRETMKELTQLLSQLKAELPRVRMSSLPKRHMPKQIVHTTEGDKAAKKAVKQMMTAQKPKPTILTESQKLEKELQDIEEKLSKL